MKWLWIGVVVLAFGASGCGNKKKDPALEGMEPVGEADTAMLDSDESIESLPTIDEAYGNSEDTPQLADSAPAAEPPVLQGTGELASYVVQEGDTLMKIAFNVYGDIRQWQSIYELNKDMLGAANRLTPGMQLKYDRPASEPMIERNGEPYLIKQGDTLGKIADEIYAKPNKWRKLWENNRTLIRDPNKIYAGFYLYYQITEEERQEVERIRGSGQQMMGGVQENSEPAPGMTGGDQPSTSGGGLDSLAAPGDDRQPANNAE